MTILGIGIIIFALVMLLYVLRTTTPPYNYYLFEVDTQCSICNHDIHTRKLLTRKDEIKEGKGLTVICPNCGWSELYIIEGKA